MSKEFVPAVVFSIGQLLKDEMEARNWEPYDVAKRMGGDIAVNLCFLDLLESEPHFDTETVVGLLLGNESAVQLERAFGISADFWLRTDELYRNWRASRGASGETPHP